MALRIFVAAVRSGLAAPSPATASRATEAARLVVALDAAGPAEAERLAQAIAAGSWREVGSDRLDELSAVAAWPTIHVRQLIAAVTPDAGGTTPPTSHDATAGEQTTTAIRTGLGGMLLLLPLLAELHLSVEAETWPSSTILRRRNSSDFSPRSARSAPTATRWPQLTRSCASRCAYRHGSTSALSRPGPIERALAAPAGPAPTTYTTIGRPFDLLPAANVMFAAAGMEFGHLVGTEAAGVVEVKPAVLVAQHLGLRGFRRHPAGSVRSDGHQPSAASAADDGRSQQPTVHTRSREGANMGLDAGRLTAWADPWMAWLNARCRCEIARLRARYALGVDELHGLYTSDEQVDRLLEQHPVSDHEHAAALLDVAEQSIAGTPLAVIASDLQLDHDEIRALVVVLAPELDLRYATVFAYLNDDLTRRHERRSLQRVAGVCPSKFDPRSPLVRLGLVDIVPRENGPWRGAAMVAHDPVRMFVLGARRSLGSDLGPLARHINTSVTSADLSVPAATGGQLHELQSAIRNREMVFRDWGLGRNRNTPMSLRAAVCGTARHRQDDGGVGHRRERRARPVPHRPVGGGQQVHRRDGEEPRAASSPRPTSANAMLFFDEADALFGKRSEVATPTTATPTSRVAYLLQRMETSTRAS